MHGDALPPQTSASTVGAAGAGPRSAETRERLLDAAAGLFAERGYAGTSMRAVTARAGASVSAANYHFGSKLALLHAVCERSIGPLNAARMRALDAAEQRAAPASPTLEALLDAFLRTAVQQSSAERAEQRAVAARLYSDPPEIVSELKRDLFGPLSERMSGLLRQLFPEAPEERIALAFQLTVGVMVHVVGGHLETSAVAVPVSSDREPVADRMIEYCAAGIRALLVCDTSAGPHTGAMGELDR